MERLTERYKDSIANVVLIRECGDKLCKDICDDIECDCSKCELEKALEKLADYEDLEEQGLLVRLPIALGSDVYFITVNNEIIHGICLDISLSDKQFYCQLGKWLKFSDIGQKVFRTRKEAEKKLEEMKAND